MRKLAGAALLVGVLAVVALGAPSILGTFGVDDGLSSSSAADRSEVLDLTFEHFDGRVVRLGDWEGTPVVANFWAAWCPPCVAEMSAAFEPVHRDLSDEVAFVGLNLQDDPARADQVVAQTGVTYDLGRDPAGELFTAFEGFGMPYTVFIDARGVVVDTHTGALSRGQLEQIISRSFGIGGS